MNIAKLARIMKTKSRHPLTALVSGVLNLRHELFDRNEIVVKVAVMRIRAKAEGLCDHPKARCRLPGFLSFIFSVGILCGPPPGARAADVQLVRARVPAAVAQLTPLSALPGNTRLSLAISLPVRNQAALTTLLSQIYDPASPQYHHYLTPEQFTEQFGPTRADYQAVAAFARARHLQVTATHANRLLLDVSGSVADINHAFHVTMRTYQHPTEKRTFYAPDTTPSLDLATPLLQISGLDNYALPRPHYVVNPAVPGHNATPNAGSGPDGNYLGNDFRAAYVPNTTLTGSGQAVGLLQFDGYTASDITYYENKAGLPNVPLQNVLLDGFNGSPTAGG